MEIICDICHNTFDSTTAICHNDTMYCVPCFDVVSFFEDAPKKEPPKPSTVTKPVIAQPVAQPIACVINCPKCKIPYTVDKCMQCNGKNPLYIKKKKK